MPTCTRFDNSGGLPQGGVVQYSAITTRSNAQIMSGFQARSENREKRLLASSCLTFRPHGKNSAPTERIFMKFGI